MARAVTIKNVKIHIRIDGMDSVEDTRAAIPHKTLKALGAKRRVCKDTKETFFLIASDCGITL